MSIYITNGVQIESHEREKMTHELHIRFCGLKALYIDCDCLVLELEPIVSNQVKCNRKAQTQIPRTNVEGNRWLKRQFSSSYEYHIKRVASVMASWQVIEQSTQVQLLSCPFNNTIKEPATLESDRQVLSGAKHQRPNIKTNKYPRFTVISMPTFL